MKKILILAAVMLACSDKNVDKRDSCLQVEQVSVPTDCYTGNGGLVLTADTPSSIALDWVIAPLKDTTGAQTYVPYYVSSPSNQITLPDSIVRKYPKIGVTYVGVLGCTSDMYFSFVRRVGADSCVRWVQQERFLKGG
ncbi:hypothetical protein GCM10010967_14680 [Dyadobacter beijingensis]|uniref:Lipoprotein n=1 Tax=Dyadobacter beijingensis TaxID=365489 RepID=A0ABQ2HJS9_9BACT|nr:hypothetical protein [Dyadobacter beijingensis]GGM83928.1 hypothetical protein GCM10010967_14680 [Dyadobacter beijingensis]